MSKRPDWLEGLTHKDWLFDGGPMGEDTWHQLDWSGAWVDMGPSPMDNLGPYWHVPLRTGDTVHRLYPKFLQGKWANVIRRAAEEWKGVS